MMAVANPTNALSRGSTSTPCRINEPAGRAGQRRQRCSGGGGAARQLHHARSRAPLLLSPRAVERQQSASDEVYAGVYGPWRITQGDELEVACYRAGLTATAVAIVGGAAIGLTSGADTDAAASSAAALDALCVLGAAGLGVSVALIHVYVTPLKRLLQALWAAGVGGGLYLAITHTGSSDASVDSASAAAAAATSLPAFVASHRWAVWLVGPYFAALSGVAVKEGICYGKAEAAVLALLLPALLLGHLTGLAPAPAERFLLVGVAGAAAVFAARKWTQAVKDDIGDGSVFNFRKLPPAEQERIVARLRQQQQAIVAAEDDGGEY